MPTIEDREASLSGSKSCNWRADELKASQEFRKAYESKTNIVLAEDMPWEHSPDGLIKHLVHEKLNTREMCVEAYMQFLKPGEKSGVHRHMWEELIFVVEGSGYDLHWDLKWDCLEAFQWEWAPSRRRIPGSAATTSTSRRSPTTSTSPATTRTAG